MGRIKTSCFALFLTLLAYGASAQSFDYSVIAPHPRLVMKAGEELRINQSIERTPIMARVHRRILDSCEDMLKKPPVEYSKKGKRLLAVSRAVLMRTYYLSYAYRMTGDERYAVRAKEEMLAASAFADWNPSHFLDTGEMVMALAIGYDWLHDWLDEATRTIVRRAILEKGFKAAENKKHARFYNVGNNWNQVCNAGLAFGALAIFEKEPDAARHIIEKCIKTNPRAMACYAPDGGYPEGVGYWAYGTSFQIMLIEALESALGHDAGMSSAPGFLQSAKFIQYLTGPTGHRFNYGDASSTATCNIMMFWCADKLSDLSVLWLEKQYLERPRLAFAEERLLPSFMVFASRIDFERISRPQNNYWYNRGETPVFAYRSGWDSPRDSYLAVKGGSARSSHAHMDAGSFVYEHDGVRWAMDLGVQSYITLEEKGVDLWSRRQDGQRWEVFRINNKNHNTLTINGRRHNVKGFAHISNVYREKDRKGVEIDMTEIFGDDVRRAVRTVTLDKDNLLHVSDHIMAGDKEASVMWVMVTGAKVRITGNNTIELEKDGRKMQLLAEPRSKVKMKIWSNVPEHDYDKPNPGTLRVGFEALVEPEGSEVFHVKLIPVR